MSRQIKTLDDLYDAVENRKSVVIKEWGWHQKDRVFPAAFVLNFNGGLLRTILRSRVFIYEKPSSLKRGEC